MGERTSNQIHISNADITIGDPLVAANDLTGSDIGILLEKLYMNGDNIYNCVFHDFSINANSNDYGIGLLANSTKFVVGGSQTNQGNNFNNNYIGLTFMSCSSSTIYYNSFDMNAGGVFGIFNFGGNINVSFNTLRNVLQGVTLIWNAKSNMTISENIITNIMSSAYLGSGISIGESDVFGSNYGAEVKQNVINSSGNYGLYFNNIAHGKIVENRVYMDHLTLTSSDIATGIRIDNSDANTLSCNEVDNKSGTDAANKYGISVFDYYKQTMNDNTTDGTEFGIQFINNCQGSTIKGNKMKNHTGGLLIGDISTTISTGLDNLTLYNNELPGNKWYTNTYDTYNCYQSQLPDLWTRNGSGSPDYPTNNFEIGGGPVISPLTQSGYNLYSGITCNTPTFVSEDDGSKEFSIALGEQIATSQLPSLSQDIVTEWKAKKALYQALKDDPSQISNSSILNAFFNSTSNGNIGKLTDIEGFLKDSQDSIAQSDSLLKASMESQAKTLNDGIMPTILPELNEKIVNDVYLNTVAKQKFHFDQQYNSDLMSVALQCVYEGGPAVLKARNLIRSQYPFILFDDRDLCSNANYRHSNDLLNKPSDLADKFCVYPNPSSDYITCMFASGTTIEISDLTGRIAFSQKIEQDSNICKIDISKLEEGSYIVSLKLGASYIKSQKIVIVH